MFLNKCYLQISDGFLEDVESQINTKGEKYLISKIRLRLRKREALKAEEITKDNLK